MIPAGARSRLLRPAGVDTARSLVLSANKRPTLRVFPRTVLNYRQRPADRTGFSYGGAGTANALFSVLCLSLLVWLLGSNDAVGSRSTALFPTRRWATASWKRGISPEFSGAAWRRLDPGRQSSAGAALCSAVEFWRPFSTSR
jgi:hypothetical protein